ncbi:MAG: YraN family protein [Actinomycetota bacterium]|jgi:putative endonuclease|nr:YraN family protein [Actinomycetota bacterium]
MPDPSPELRRGRSLKNRSSGAWGEELALRYLTRQGYTLVERNYRTRYGELDLVVRHGTTLVFVEVKLRRGTGFGDPLEAVTPRKQARIRSLAELYLLDREPAFDTVRFDVVGILLGKGPPSVRHIEDAF